MLDPSFKGTVTADCVTRVAAERRVAVEWQPGSVLTVAEIPSNAPAGPDREIPLWRAFCAGGRAARLGHQVVERYSGDGVHLDAAAIGPASTSAFREPDRWRAWGAAAEVQQQLKYLWPILLSRGRPPALSSRSSEPSEHRGRSG